MLENSLGSLMDRTKLRNRVAGLLSYLTAAWCAFFIMVPSSWSVGIAGALLWTPFSADGDRAYLFGRASPPLLAALCITLYFGVAFSRFLLRAVPPQLSGNLHGRVGILILIFFGCVVPALYNWFKIGWADSDWSYLLTRGVLVALPVILWGACAVTPLYVRHRRPRRLLTQPFILFLRRFSTFSDRSVIGTVLRLAPVGKPVVFLTSTKSQPGDWNPFIVGFAGLKLRNPFRSVPLVLRAPDANWRETAEELISHAQVIVIDISERGNSIETEVGLIDKASRWDDTVCLKMSATTDDIEIEHMTGLKGCRVIEYKKSWSEAMPRLLIGVCTVILAPFYVPLVFGTSMRVVFNTGSELLGSTALFAIILLSTLGGIYYSTFVIPSMNLGARLELKKALHDERKQEV